MSQAFSQPQNKEIARAGGGRWLPGQSGNPGGREKGVDVNALCRTHTVEAVNKTVKLMRTSKDERIQLTAATAILDRGWGKPAQSVSVDGASAADLTLLHLLAARALHDIAQPTLEAKVVADETTLPPDLYAPASE